jgi:cardiolipin synthase
MHKPSYYIINGITVYRIVAAPFLIFLIFTGRVDLFKWLLAVSFFTDLVDGYLVRRYKTTSIFGARLDSVGDDLTVLAAVIGLLVLKTDFIKEQMEIFIILFVLYAFQNISALIKYRKMTGFHTYSAKAAAILQGLFLILIFLLPQPVYPLFYGAAIATGIDLIEETILVILLPK